MIRQISSAGVAALRPPSIGLSEGPNSLPFVGGALPDAASGVALQRLLYRKDRETQNERPDFLLLAGSLIGLIVLAALAHKGGLSQRTNQEIFEAALARSRQGAYSAIWRFDLVDALLKEGARTRLNRSRRLQKAIVDDRTQLASALLPKYARYFPIGRSGAKQGAIFL